MLAGRQADEWNKPIIPIEATDRPTPSLSLDEAVKLALSRRPELASLDTTRAQNEIDREYFQNQARPQMDLVGAYTLVGPRGQDARQRSPTTAIAALDPSELPCWRCPFLRGRAIAASLDG